MTDIICRLDANQIKALELVLHVAIFTTISLGLERGKKYIVKVSAYNGVSHLAHPSESGMVQASILFGNYYIIQRVGGFEGRVGQREARRGRNGGESVCMQI